MVILLVYVSYCLGAIKGLIALGPRTIQLVLIPNVAGYARLLDAKLKGVDDEQIQAEGKKCWDALLACFNVIHVDTLQQISGYYLSTAAQYHEDVERLLKKEEEKIEKEKGEASMKKRSKYARESLKEPGSKRRKLDHLKPTKDSSVHQTILFHELNTITTRFEELFAVFGDSLLNEMKDRASFYTAQQNQNNEG